jgi:predicted NACHT family NTPase
VERQWVREERHRKIHDPAPLPVRWHPAPDHLVDHWVNIHRVPAGGAAGPIALAGTLDEIAEVYRRIPSGRLVILGPGGAGKTVLVARLVLDLLAGRTAGGPVPVIVSIGSWDPTTSLAGWLADQLVRDHPGLAATRSGGPHLAAALLDAKLIVPILDGFDEIPQALQRPALQQLNTVSDLSLVVTSRPEEYTAAVAGTDVLTAAAGIELDPLSLDDLADYCIYPALPLCVKIE